MAIHIAAMSMLGERNLNITLTAASSVSEEQPNDWEVTGSNRKTRFKTHKHKQIYKINVLQ